MPFCFRNQLVESPDLAAADDDDGHMAALRQVDQDAFGAVEVGFVCDFVDHGFNSRLESAHEPLDAHGRAHVGLTSGFGLDGGELRHRPRAP